MTNDHLSCRKRIEPFCASLIQERPLISLYHLAEVLLRWLRWLCSEGNFLSIDLGTRMTDCIE